MTPFHHFLTQILADKEDVLGSGHFGVVFKGKYQGKSVAVKTPKERSDTSSHIKVLLTELKVMIHIGDHPNVVNLIGAQTGGLKKGVHVYFSYKFYLLMKIPLKLTKNCNLFPAQLYIAVEYCQLGDLEQYLRSHKEYFVDPSLPTGYISGGTLTRYKKILKRG